MPELETREREALPRDDFAYSDSNGEKHLPIHDAEHVRNALARWNQTDFESQASRERARRRILAAARRFGIEVAEDDIIRQGLTNE